MRRQPSIRGVRRQPSSTALYHEVREIVDEVAEAFECARSWVIATAVCDHLGIKLDPEMRYDQSRPRRRRSKSGALQIRRGSRAT